VSSTLASSFLFGLYFPPEGESPTGISIGSQGSLIRKGRMSFP
jgi:hypothetical protein